MENLQNPLGQRLGITRSVAWQLQAKTRNTKLAILTMASSTQRNEVESLKLYSWCGASDIFSFTDPLHLHRGSVEGCGGTDQC